MKRVAVHNQTRPVRCPPIAVYCHSFLCRLRGLTFRRRLANDEALLLVERRDSRLDASIHMLFVFTNLAVVWVNSAGEVVDVCLARAWRPAYVPLRPARYILEMHPSQLDDFCIGDQVRFEEVWLD